MREIKFRGITIHEHRWEFGDLVRNMCFDPDGSKRDCVICSDNDYADVIPESVGQFTGLHDKNGKEIYEGDIVKPVKFNDIINTVEYISHGFYRVKRHNGKPYLNALGSCDVIIIGNIYENPTLIK